MAKKTKSRKKVTHRKHKAPIPMPQYFWHVMIASFVVLVLFYLYSYNGN